MLFSSGRLAAWQPARFFSAVAGGVFFALQIHETDPPFSDARTGPTAAPHCSWAHPLVAPHLRPTVHIHATQTDPTVTTAEIVVEDAAV